MIFLESDITKKGHALLKKVLAGEIMLEFTSVYCGDGNYTGDIWDMEGLVNPKLQGEFIKITSEPQERRTLIQARFTNETVTEFFMLQEIGVFVRDGADDILFAYAKAGERANFIEAFNGKWNVEEEISFYVFTASTADIIAEVVKSTWACEIGYDNQKSGLPAKELQSAIDELYVDHIRFYPLLPNLHHGLSGYPLALTIECNYGAGIFGAGNDPAGGTESIQLRNNVTYLDKDRISISVGKKYNTVKSVTKISDKEYIVLFDDSTLSLLIVLYTMDGMGGTGGGGSGSGTSPDPEYIATDAEIDEMLEQILGQ